VFPETQFVTHRRCVRRHRAECVSSHSSWSHTFGASRTASQETQYKVCEETSCLLSLFTQFVKCVCCVSPHSSWSVSAVSLHTVREVCLLCLFTQFVKCVCCVSSHSVYCVSVYCVSSHSSWRTCTAATVGTCVCVCVCVGERTLLYAILVKYLCIYWYTHTYMNYMCACVCGIFVCSCVCVCAWGNEHCFTRHSWSLYGVALVSRID